MKKKEILRSGGSTVIGFFHSLTFRSGDTAGYVISLSNNWYGAG
jgi:hypothetical protein